MRISSTAAKIRTAINNQKYDFERLTYYKSVEEESFTIIMDRKPGVTGVRKQLVLTYNSLRYGGKVQVMRGKEYYYFPLKDLKGLTTKIKDIKSQQKSFLFERLETEDISLPHLQRLLEEKQKGLLSHFHYFGSTGYSQPYFVLILPTLDIVQHIDGRFEIVELPVYYPLPQPTLSRQQYLEELFRGNN